MMKIKYSVESPTKSLRSLFGHCQLRVFLADKLFVDIGRFSSSAIDRLRMYKNLAATGCVAKIGDFCEFANSEILLGGEHPNNSVVNQVLSGCPTFQALIERNGFDTRHKSKGILSVGHGVIVGHGAKIMSGAYVGAGAVVAAGAIVSGHVPEFAVVAGVPARVIRTREVDQEASKTFWEMNLSQIFGLTTGKKIPDKDGPYNRDNRLVIRMASENESEEGKFGGFEIMGVQSLNGFIRPKTGSQFMDYCSQVSLKKGDLAEWVSNPFALDMER